MEALIMVAASLGPGAALLAYTQFSATSQEVVKVEFLTSVFVSYLVTAVSAY